MNWLLAAACLVCAAQGQAQYGGFPSASSSPSAYRPTEPPVVPVILPGGFIADTEEVARAKEYHLSAFAHAASSAKQDKYSADYSDQYTQPKYTAAAQTYSAAAQPRYTQAYTATPQQQLFSVAHAQAYSAPQRQSDYNVPQPRYTAAAASDYSGQDYQSAAKAVTYQQPAYSSKPRYDGPPVIPVVLPNGYIAETADVEAAKQHHFQLVAQAQEAVARAQARAKQRGGYATPAQSYAAPAQAYASPTPSYAYSNKNYDDGQYDEADEYSSNQVYQAASAPVYKQARQPYQGPAAVPVVLPSGHIADTAEVAAAKISHLQQLLDAAQKSLPQQRYER